MQWAEGESSCVDVQAAGPDVVLSLIFPFFFFFFSFFFDILTF